MRKKPAQPEWRKHYAKAHVLGDNCWTDTHTRRASCVYCHVTVWLATCVAGKLKEGAEPCCIPCALERMKPMDDVNIIEDLPQ